MLGVLPAIISALGAEAYQIITPLKRGTAGTETIHTYFHQLVTPGRLTVAAGRICEGEPIIWTRNDWTRGFMNGSLGRVLRVDAKSNATRVELDGITVNLGPSDWQYVDLAFVMVRRNRGFSWSWSMAATNASRGTWLVGRTSGVCILSTRTLAFTETGKRRLCRQRALSKSKFFRNRSLLRWSQPKCGTA